jgi:hypothetical protein
MAPPKQPHDPTEQLELAEIKRLARLRCLEALREGVPRASMMAQILKLLTETANLQPPENEPPRVPFERLPFPASDEPERPRRASLGEHHDDN